MFRARSTRAAELDDPLRGLAAAPAPAPDEAAQRCAAALRSSGARLAALHVAAPGPVRTDFAALLAWLVLVERSEADEVLRGALARELAGAETGAPASTLAAALGPASARCDVPFGQLRAGLDAVTRTERGFGTREELLEYARVRCATPCRVFAQVFGLDSDRGRALVDAVGVGLRLSSWVRNAGREWRRGRLVVPSEDLARAEVRVSEIAEGSESTGTRVLLAELADWSRTWLRKGWPLAFELGPVRGRGLAAVLRWNDAALARLADGEDRSSLANGTRPPIARWPWIGAALVTRDAP